MRAPAPGNEPQEPGEEARRKTDLSVPQVAGSALAAVIAAKLASTLGVYGTILGAGVISVIATCGGPLFQQLLKRTGEQMRDATAAGRPKARQVPLPAPAEAGDDCHTLMPGTVPGAAAPFPYDEEFGSATTHGTRVRGWKRPVLAAALVFGVTMGGITAYELVSGEDFSGTRGTTTFGSVVRGDGAGRQHGPEQPERERQTEAPAPTGSASPGAEPDADTPSTGATPDPGTGTPSGGATTAPTPDPTGSADGGTTPSQEPTGPTSGPTTGPTAPVSPTGPTSPASPTSPTEDPGTGPALGDAPTDPSGDTAG
ncbi:hypothetical protein HHL19_33380 [Streptomyces sp. R302]|nr:hypothetical protein [Streptomyces sp. R301]NML83407.1 hypothetical protein [Streptomyces sp. R302]